LKRAEHVLGKQSIKLVVFYIPVPPAPLQIATGQSSSATTTTVGCLAINLTPGWLLQFEIWSLLDALQQRSVRFDIELGIM
jgi:hypothetical protein